MRLLLILLGVLAGAVLPVQVLLNARVGREAGNPVVGSFVSFVVGALSLTVLLLAWQGANLGRQLRAATAAPPWALAGGLLGAFYVTTVVLLAPRLGATLTVALVVVGQLLLALLLDQYGLLGVPLQPVTAGKGAGVVLLLLGLWFLSK